MKNRSHRYIYIRLTLREVLTIPVTGITQKREIINRIPQGATLVRFFTVGLAEAGYNGDPRDREDVAYWLDKKYYRRLDFLLELLAKYEKSLTK